MMQLLERADIPSSNEPPPSASGSGDDSDSEAFWAPPSKLVRVVKDVDVDAPPETLETIEFCAEKCRYLPKMCSEGLHRDMISLPAPTCLAYSTTVPDDVYWKDEMDNGGKGISSRRHNATARLVHWAAARARKRREAKLSSVGRSTGVRCEDVPTNYTSPMMFPEEFEFVTKLMANLQPQTYLEWGCGMSTSFYPLMASGTVVAIDGYPPWCRQVGDEPRVKCMREDEGRLHFHCPALTKADGVTPLALLGVGKISGKTPNEDVESAMSIYVNSVTASMQEANVTSFDVALVDGRFRVQCALKLLPYLRDKSVVLMHDFWVRYQPYKVVLDYYYVIGYARSVVALRKRELGLTKGEERDVYNKYMKRKDLTWVDIGKGS